MIQAAAVQLEPANYPQYEALTRTVRYGVNLHPLWIESYIKAFSVRQHVIIEARDDQTGELRGWLPLVRKDSQANRFILHRRLVAAGYGPTDFFGMPATPGYEDDVAAAFVEWFVREGRTWDQLMVNLIPDDRSTAFTFANRMTAAGFDVRVTSDWNYLTLDTSGSFETYLTCLGAEKVKEIRYYRNRLLKRGRRLEIEHLTHGGAAHFPEYAALYTQRRNAKAQSDPYTRVKALHDFVRTIIPLYEPRGWMTLSLLKLDDVPVAYCYCLAYEGVLYYYNPTFREEYRDCSPGKVLLFELIQRAFDAPSVHEFNFMRSEYGYKRWFVPSPSPYYTITADNPRSPRTIALRAIDRWRRPRVLAEEQRPA